MRFCRQCGRAYATSKVIDIVQPLPIASMSEMHAVTRAVSQVRPQKRVYVLD
jgi:hypothetical protein